MSRLFAAVAVASIAFASASVNAQFVMMPDSTNNRVVLFDPTTGAVVNPNYFATSGGTTVHSMQVGNEIWISEQIGDRVSRWSLTGTFLGQIGGQVPGGGLDNVRGMGRVGNTVYVTNAGTANGAPGTSAVVMYDTSGNPMGNFLTTGLAPSPFGILSYRNGTQILVSSSSGNNDVHIFDLAGNSVGPFHNSTSLNFAEQMNYNHAGNVLVAGFSSNNVVTLDANTGALMTSFAASGARGVYQLGNGNIMWTNGSGAHIYDVGAGTSSLVYAGGGRYLDFLLIPAPGSAALLGLAGLTAIRRRRA